MFGVCNTMRLPSPLIKDILLNADFSVENLIKMRQEHPFFADMLSDNSFWVPHSPHGLAARSAPKELLPALRRRQAAYQAFMQQRTPGRKLQLSDRGLSAQKLAYLSFDRAILAARKPNFGDFDDLASEVWGYALEAGASIIVLTALLKDLTFATAVVRNVKGPDLTHVLNAARHHLGRRKYQVLCQTAVAKNPWLIYNPMFKLHGGEPAEENRALAVQAVTADPRIFAGLAPDMRRQVPLIRFLEANAGLHPGHLNPRDQKDPEYIRLLINAHLFENDPYFNVLLIRANLGPPPTRMAKFDAISFPK